MDDVTQIYVQLTCILAGFSKYVYLLALHGYIFGSRYIFGSWYTLQWLCVYIYM